MGLEDVSQIEIEECRVERGEHIGDVDGIIGGY
jgi:hypothetical protein